MRFKQLLPVWLVGLAAWGCGSSDDEASSSGTGGTTATKACAEIDSLCHDADDGSKDLATECHHLGHIGNEDDCSARREECVDFCNAKLGQGGGHGHGGADGDNEHDH